MAFAIQDQEADDCPVMHRRQYKKKLKIFNGEDFFVMIIYYNREYIYTSRQSVEGNVVLALLRPNNTVQYLINPFFLFSFLSFYFACRMYISLLSFFLFAWYISILFLLRESLMSFFSIYDTSH